VRREFACGVRMCVRIEFACGVRMCVRMCEVCGEVCAGYEKECAHEV